MNILRLTIMGGLYCNKNKYTCLTRPDMALNQQTSLIQSKKEIIHEGIHSLDVPPGQQIQDQIMPEQWN